MNNTINRFFQYSENLASGAQPTANQIIKLANERYEVIVNISPASAKNSLKDEAVVVEESGMYYIHFPVDCSNLNPVHYKTFEGIMNGLKDKKTFVHCGGNIKSSNLIHMYDVIATGKDEKESLETLYKIQLPEEKWFRYFNQMGMKGEK